MSIVFLCIFMYFYVLLLILPSSNLGVQQQARCDMWECIKTKYDSMDGDTIACICGIAAFVIAILIMAFK
jgi:hypothetical protein